MKLTFPHMGDMYIPIKAMMAELGIDTVVPPRSGRKTVTLGAAHCPEFACFPLKLTMGNLLEAIEMGADSVLMAGGSGPCRFGYYAQVERQVLHDLGHKVDFHVLEPPQTHFFELARSLCKLLGKGVTRIPCAATIGWEKALACDELLRMAHRSRPFEQKPGVVSLWHQKYLDQVDNASSVVSVREALSGASHALIESITPQADRKPLRVSLLGEIFMVMEPAANLKLEEKLGRLGAIVERKIFITDWVKSNLLPYPWKQSHKEITENAKPYLNHFVGGDGVESVGYSVLSARDGLDGVIHVMPFTCMPEIVARSVLPEVSREKGIPVLSLSFDEHTGEAGLDTRLEAFVDLIQARRGYAS